MSNMLSATEKTRPILEYVRELEGKVTYYKNAQRYLDIKVFVVGFLLGALTASGWFWWYIRHH